MTKKPLILMLLDYLPCNVNITQNTHTPAHVAVIHTGTVFICAKLCCYFLYRNLASYLYRSSSSYANCVQISLVFVKDLVLMLFTDKAESTKGARNEHFSDSHWVIVSKHLTD